MSEGFEKFTLSAADVQERASELVEKLFTVAKPGAVFGEPLTVGDRTVITASEVKVGMGFGYGFGGGTNPNTPDDAEIEKAETPDAGFGGGGGGGGVSGGRPVAAIEIGPDGVRVEPIVDVTKVALAFFTAFGSMFFMLRKMRRGA